MSELNAKNVDLSSLKIDRGGGSGRVTVVTIANMSSLEVETDVSESNIQKVIIG